MCGCCRNKIWVEGGIPGEEPLALCPSRVPDPVSGHVAALPTTAERMGLGGVPGRTGTRFRAWRGVVLHPESLARAANDDTC